MACRMNDNVLTTFQQQVMNYEENEHVIIKDNQKFFAASVVSTFFKTFLHQLTFSNYFFYSFCPKTRPELQAPFCPTTTWL